MNREEKEFRDKYRLPNRKTENKRANAKQINSIREFSGHVNDVIKQQKQANER